MSTFLFVWSTSIALAQTSDPAETPVNVRIVAPTAGVLRDLQVRFEAEVVGADFATLTLNGSSYQVPVEDGRVEQTLVAVPGNNRVAISANTPNGTARDSVTFHYDGDPVELVVLLSFPGQGEIIDLWVREPGGETCKWDHRETGAGGRLLDFSSTAIGFGSQAYVLPRARAGRFRVKVHYWSSAYTEYSGYGSRHEQLIHRLDELDAELAGLLQPPHRARLQEQRTRTLERLDQWSLPRAPQRAVHAEVVLFPGSPQERRWRFDVITQHTGSLTEVGEIEIDRAMLDAARRSGQ